jgi:hypothetical protein
MAHCYTDKCISTRRRVHAPSNKQYKMHVCLLISSGMRMLVNTLETGVKLVLKIFYFFFWNFLEAIKHFLELARITCCNMGNWENRIYWNCNLQCLPFKIAYILPISHWYLFDALKTSLISPQYQCDAL